MSTNKYITLHCSIVLYIYFVGNEHIIASVMHGYQPLGKAPGLDFRSTFTFSQKGKPASSETKYSSVSMNILPDTQYMNPEKSYLNCLCTSFVKVLSYLLFIVTLPFSAFFCFKLAHQYERIIIYRIGRLLPLKGPGLVLVLPCIDRWSRVDLRTKAFNVPPTRICTADGGLLLMGSVIHFRVQNPLLAQNSLQDMNHSVRVRAQAAMSKILSKKSFSDVMTSASRYSYDIQVDINAMAHEWGIEVGRVELSHPVAEVEPKVQQPGFFEQLSSGFGGGGDAMTRQLVNICAGTATKKQQNTMQNSSKNIESYDIETSAAGLINAVSILLNEKMVSRVDASYEIKLTDNGSYYYIDLKTGKGCCGKGRLPSGEPDATLILSFDTLHQLLSGQVGAFSAYTSGDLELEGSVKTAMRLEELVKCMKGQ